MDATSLKFRDSSHFEELFQSYAELWPDSVRNVEVTSPYLCHCADFIHNVIQSIGEVKGASLIPKLQEVAEKDGADANLFKKKLNYAKELFEVNHEITWPVVCTLANSICRHEDDLQKLSKVVDPLIKHFCLSDLPWWWVRRVNVFTNEWKALANIFKEEKYKSVEVLKIKFTTFGSASKFFQVMGRGKFNFKYLSLNQFHPSKRDAQREIAIEDLPKALPIEDLPKAMTSKDCKLETLELCFCKLDDHGMKKLSMAIMKSDCHLRELRFIYCHITEKQMVVLKESITRQGCCLKSLCVEDDYDFEGQINTSSILVQALEDKQCCLSEVSLKLIYTWETIFRLANALVCGGRLEKLTLLKHRTSHRMKQYLRSYQSFSPIIKAIAKTKLKYLELLLDGQQEEIDLAHPSVLQGLITIKLTVVGDCTGQNIVEAIHKVLINKQCKLVNLDLSGCTISQDDQMHILDALDINCMCPLRTLNWKWSSKAMKYRFKGLLDRNEMLQKDEHLKHQLMVSIPVTKLFICGGVGKSMALVKNLFHWCKKKDLFVHKLPELGNSLDHSLAHNYLISSTERNMFFIVYENDPKQQQKCPERLEDWLKFILSRRSLPRKRVKPLVFVLGKVDINPKYEDSLIISKYQYEDLKKERTKVLEKFHM